MLLVFMASSVCAQLTYKLNWSKEGNSFYLADQDGIAEISLATRTQNIIVTKQQNLNHNIK